MIIKESTLARGLPKKTQSLCPECGKIIDATIYDNSGSVWIKKTCPEHGEVKDIYWNDTKMFLKAEEWAADGIGIENPAVTKDNPICPLDCGLCKIHTTHTNLANLDLTNRCNLKCPICFANANEQGFVFEPDLDTVKRMLKNLRDERPVPTPAIQFAGGEPTIYPQYYEALSAARDLGFVQIQVATNGIKLAEDPEFAQKSVDAGLHTVYLQFDGLKEDDYIQARGRPLLDVKLKAIEACRRTKPKPLSTILVPTVIRTINEDQVGEMLNFAIENSDVIRGVNYQPVAFTGRIDYEKRMEMRVTLPDLVNLLSEQTGYMTKEDFYPVPFVTPISELVSAISGECKLAFTTHPHCGVASFLVINEDGEVVPITRYVDVEGMMARMKEMAAKANTTLGQFAIKFYGSLRSDKKKKQAAMKSFDKYFGEFIHYEKLPDWLNLQEILTDVVGGGKKDDVGAFTWRTMFVGGMHFQDNYNYDIERVKRCAIHYATPDDRIIPFCAYNGGPTYRREIESKYSISKDEWKKRNPGRSIME
ncbi:MAG: radical SAM protein [Candidatus Thermoplasmatota archaeon]|nr:radical SAM protein [Candidatus Thermoplasmatota archaeon]